MRYMTPSPKPLQPYLNLLKPFSSRVWSAVVGTLVAGMAVCAAAFVAANKIFGGDKKKDLTKFVIEAFAYHFAENVGKDFKPFVWRL